MTPDFSKQPEHPPQGYAPGAHQDGAIVPQPYGYAPQQQTGYAPQGYPQQGYPQPYQRGPVGQVRGTGFGILMTIVTLGIYPLYWYFVVHEEMKRHSGQGIGGGIALLLAFFIGVASPFLASSEVGNLHTSLGRRAPVSGATGFWYYPGFLLFFIGPIVWWVKTNGALNDYWRAVGAR